MSWWIARTDDRGRRELWGIDFDPLLTLVVISLPLITLLLNGLLSLTMLVAGVTCLVISKVSLFRRGIWVSWGPRMMSARSSAIYKLGYVLMAAGAVLRLTLHV